VRPGPLDQVRDMTWIQCETRTRSLVPQRAPVVGGGSAVFLLYAGHSRVLSVRRVHTSSSLKLKNVHPRGRVLNPGDFSRGKKTYHSSSLESRCIYLLSLGAQDGCELCGRAATGRRELDSEDIHQPAHNSPESSSGRFTSSCLLVKGGLQRILQII